LSFADGRIKDAAVMHSDDGTDRASRRGGAFFGRRKGKKLRARQADLMQSLLPHLSLDLSNPAPQHLAELFSSGAADVRMEIGFGGAEHLIAQAEQNPDTGFIGIEPFENGMAKALAAIERHGLTNIRLHHGDATEVLGWLPPGVLSRVDLLYPDPWPKRRHWKRRFVQDASVAAIARVLRSSGEFRFASDIADYCAWTLARLLRSPDFEWTAEKADDWQVPWPDYERTRYEAKAVREGRTPCYLTFRRR
jgi:tRNA (guanine-N7-)-methyltransferase